MFEDSKAETFRGENVKGCLWQTNPNVLTNVLMEETGPATSFAAEGRPTSLTENTAWASLSNHIHSFCTLHPASFPSPFYIMRVLLLCKPDIQFKVCSEEKWHRTNLANSWRPSSRRRDVPGSFAPSDTMRKWRSLNKVTWSSVWGRVTCSSSRQRSFTHTPATTQQHKLVFSEVERRVLSVFRCFINYPHFWHVTLNTELIMYLK